MFYPLFSTVYNYYNFGLFTQCWDWLFGTLKHPDATSAKFTLAQKAKRTHLGVASVAELDKLAARFGEKPKEKAA
jgi:sterol desaturase/sphingolipid hydroxylase (fatty acid hydroxylase superfamily)